MHEPLLTAISSSLMRKLSVTDTQGLSNTAWAFSTILFFDALLREAVSLVQHMRNDANA